MYLSSKYKHRLKDELDNGDCSVLVVWLICQLLSELCIGFFKPTNLMFKSCHVLSNGGVNPAKVLPCRFLQFLVDVHRFRTTSKHILTNFGFCSRCSFRRQANGGGINPRSHLCQTGVQIRQKVVMIRNWAGLQATTPAKRKGRTNSTPESMLWR